MRSNNALRSMYSLRSIHCPCALILAWADCCDHGRRRHVNFADSFNDLFEGRSYIARTFDEQVERVRMTVDCCPIGKAVLRCDSSRTLPVDEVPLDLFTVRMSADSTVALRNEEAGGSNPLSSTNIANVYAGF